MSMTRIRNGCWSVLVVLLVIVAGWGRPSVSVAAADDGAAAMCMLDDAQAPAVELSSPADTVDDAAADPAAHRHGYCKCGCGATCTTSADCGGAACVQFITCC